MAAREGDSHLGFISGPNVSLFFMHSVFNLMKDDWEHRFLADYIVVPGPYIHENRNRLVAEFMDAGRDWLFMVDNDMVFDPGDVWELFKVADEHGPGIYSAPYQDETSVIVAGPWDDEVPMVYHPLVRIPKEPAQVGVVGAGFTLVHREVYDAMDLKPYSSIRPDGGEDVSFCWRAREAGFIPWLVPTAHPGHHKTFVIYPSGQMRNIYGEDVNLIEVSGPDGNRVAPQEVGQ